jgi:ribosomal protein S18 acetylase RimI-like enzyme
MITAFEERSANAWPAPRTVLVDGWVARFAGGYSRRANSVLPLYGGSGSDGSRLDACEGLYRGEGLRCAFKLTEASPPGLDDRLKTAGYALEAPTAVMTLETLPVPRERATPPPCEALVSARPDDSWMEAWLGFSRVAAGDRPVAAAIVSSIIPERRFILLRDGGSPVACAMVVVEGGWAGVFDVVVKPGERGRGLGRAVMDHALAEAAKAGARASYLQVMEDNMVAARLYASLGYRQAYRYWYRRQGGAA